MLKNKSILLVSPEKWSELHVSKHHYAIHLASRGNKVIFLNPPSKKIERSKTLYENLDVLDYQGFIRGMRYLPSFLRRLLTIRVYRKIEKLVGASFDIIWSFDNSVFYDFDALPNNVQKISHIVDLNMNFELERATKSADVCLCSSNIIFNRLEQFRKDGIFIINHGLSIGETTKAKNEVLPGNNTIKAIYAGNLAMRYLDWKSLDQVVRNHSNVDFIFYGSNAAVFDQAINHLHSFKRKIYKANNSYFPGIIESHHLISIIEKGDVLLICYQQEHHQDQANPHKVLEYLYTGKPTVATFTEEYCNSELIIMSNNNEDWPDLFEKTVINLKNETTSFKMERRKSFALENTYPKQIERIEKIISTF